MQNDFQNQNSLKFQFKVKSTVDSTPPLPTLSGLKFAMGCLLPAYFQKLFLTSILLHPSLNGAQYSENKYIIVYTATMFHVKISKPHKWNLRYCNTRDTSHIYLYITWCVCVVCLCVNMFILRIWRTCVCINALLFKTMNWSR